jgi:hypothetical protein
VNQTVFYKETFEGDSYRLTFGYDAQIVKLIKNLPAQYRTWDREHKDWTIADHQMEFLQALLKTYDYPTSSMGKESRPREYVRSGHNEHSYTNTDYDSNARDAYDRAKWGRQQNTRPPRSSPSNDWAHSLFRAVGPDRAEAVYKALSRVLHPDTPTGDHQLMQQLNEARRR